MRLICSPGQRNDIAFAHELLDGFEADATIADKGYDADHLCDRIAETGSARGRSNLTSCIRRSHCPLANPARSDEQTPWFRSGADGARAAQCDRDHCAARSVRYVTLELLRSRSPTPIALASGVDRV